MCVPGSLFPWQCTPNRISHPPNDLFLHNNHYRLSRERLTVGEWGVICKVVVLSIHNNYNYTN